MNNPKSESKEEKDMKEKSTTDKKIGARKRRKSTVEKSMGVAFNQFKETAKDDFERYMINYTYQDVPKVEGVKSNRLNLRLFDSVDLFAL